LADPPIRVQNQGSVGCFFTSQFSRNEQFSRKLNASSVNSTGLISARLGCGHRLSWEETDDLKPKCVKRSYFPHRRFSGSSASADVKFTLLNAAGYSEAVGIAHHLSSDAGRATARPRR
jgi:hypothetical protein